MMTNESVLALTSSRGVVRWWAAILGTVAVVGCVPEFDDDVSQVEGFRVLAVRAEPAEVAPGDEVVLSVLWASPEGETVEADEIGWAFCNERKELTEPGPVAPACIEQFGDPESEVLGDLGNGASVSGTLARDVCRFFGPLAPPSEPGVAVPGRPADPDVTGGFYQPVLVGQETATLGGVRLSCGTPWLSREELVLFNQGYRPNEHPEFSEVELAREGTASPIDTAEVLEVSVGEELTFRVNWAGCPRAAECGDGLCTMGENSTNCADDCRTEPVGCTGAEDYLLADVQTRTALPKRELLSVAWFATGGVFESSVTDDPEEQDLTENVWTAPASPGSFGLWLVLRDDRGGVSWRELRVSVTNP